MQQAIKIIDDEIKKVRPQDYENMIIVRTLTDIKQKLESAPADKSPSASTPITEEELLKAGFRIEYRDDPELDVFHKDGIDVWEVTNNEGWIIDMLDDVCIDKYFRYMEELELFFTACGLALKS